MDMEIHKAGGYNLSLGVDCLAAGFVQPQTHGLNQAVFNQNILPRQSFAVENSAIFYNCFHLFPLFNRIEPAEWRPCAQTRRCSSA